jgi:hypothetical protein
LKTRDFSQFPKLDVAGSSPDSRLNPVIAPIPLVSLFAMPAEGAKNVNEIDPLGRSVVPETPVCQRILLGPTIQRFD